MDKRWVYKAFRLRKDGGLGFLFHGHEGSRAVPRGVWLRARARWVRNGRVRRYRAGFHCFPDSDSASAFLILTRGKYVLRRVMAGGLRPKPRSNAGAWLAREILVPGGGENEDFKEQVVALEGVRAVA